MVCLCLTWNFPAPTVPLGFFSYQLLSVALMDIFIFFVVAKGDG